MTSRMGAINVAAMSAQQKAIYDDILSRRGMMGGPFMAWLRNPEMADKAQSLGAYCRYDSTLPHRLSELAIIIVGRHWSAQVEWAIHAEIAAEAGISADIIAAIKAGETPAFDAADEEIIYRYTTSLLRSTRVSQSLHEEAVAMLGENQLVDLVAIIGYYGLVALTLNAFNMPVPDGLAVPFDEPDPLN